MGKLKLLIILAICNTLSPLALQILVPALPTIRVELHASLAQTQAVLSAFSLALALSMLAYGPLADHFNRKRLLIVGLLIFSLGSLIGYKADSIEVLIAARVLQALGIGAASTITRAVLADAYKGDDLNRAMSILLMVVIIGPMLAPVLGGYMVDSSRWNNIMLVLLGLGLGMALLAASFLEKINALSDTGHAEHYWEDLGAVLKNRGFLNNMAVLMLVQIGVYAFISASPYLIIEVLHYSATQYGFIFIYLTLAYMAGNLFSGVVVKKLGGNRLILFATSLYLVGALMFIGLAFSNLKNLYTIAGPALVLAFTNGIIQPNCAAGILASTKGKKGSVASLSGFGQIMATAVGLQIMGFLDITSVMPVAIVIGTCGIIALVAASFLNRQTKAAS